MSNYKIVIIFFIITLSACSRTVYYAAPIQGVVLNGETQEALSDAVVVTYLVEEIVLLEGRGAKGLLHVNLTTTNDKGYFRFSEWGPASHYSTALLNNRVMLLIYKSGFMPKLITTKANTSNNLSKKINDEMQSYLISLVRSNEAMTWTDFEFKVGDYISQKLVYWSLTDCQKAILKPLFLELQKTASTYNHKMFSKYTLVDIEVIQEKDGTLKCQ
jgi:hypothetical protein